MTALQILFSHLPLLMTAACLVALYRRTGHRGAALGLSALPLIVGLFSLAAAWTGDSGLSQTAQGQWTAAAVVVVLTLKAWPKDEAD